MTLASNLSSRRSVTGTSAGQETAGNHHAYKDYLKRRNLILALIKREIDRLATWHNPLARSERNFPGEESLVNWANQTVLTERNWRDLVRLAWRISPDIAVNLPDRYVDSPRAYSELISDASIKKGIWYFFQNNGLFNSPL